IAMYDAATRQLNYRNHNPVNDAAIDYFKNTKYGGDIFCEPSGKIWMLTWSPLEIVPRYNWYNPQTKQGGSFTMNEKIGLGYHVPHGFLRQRNGHLWLYGAPYIAEITDSANSVHKLSYENCTERIKFDDVLCMYEDREKNLWAGTNNGLLKFNPSKEIFNSVNLMRPKNNTIAEGTVMAMLQPDSATLWVSSWDAGAFAYNKNMQPLPFNEPLNYLMTRNAIWCMMKHSSGVIWLAYQGGYIGVHDPVKKTADYFSLPVFEQKTIRKIAEDRDGNIWFGTHKGQLIKWDYKQSGGDYKKGYTLIKKFESSSINQILTDSKGYIWICTGAHGLLKINPQSGAVEDEYGETSVPAKRIEYAGATDMVMYNDSLLAVASRGLILININREKIVATYKEKDGLPGENIVSIAKDANGFLWMGMANGLCRVHPFEKVFTKFDRSNGILDDAFTVAAAWRLNDGRMLFGANHNFLLFNPAETFSSAGLPKVKITTFWFENRRLNVDSLMKLERVTVAHNQNSVELQFSTLSYSNNQYKIYYRLSYLDKEWKLADEDNHALYNYIPPGNYVFQVKCVDGAGKTSPVTIMKIYVRPSFWQTPWFYALLVLAGLFIFYRLYKTTEQRRKKEEKLRSRIAGNLHSEVSATLGSVNVLSEMAKMKMDEDSAAAKDYINKISFTTAGTIEAMQDILWSIDPQNDTMQKTAERMKQIAADLLGTKNIAYSFCIHDNVLRTSPDMQMRHHLLGIYKSLIKNITENTPCYQVNIDLNKKENYLLLSIEDDGKGFTQEELQHNKARLKEMYAKAETLHASIDTDTAPGKGTRVMVSIPI
ncbi:MAG TPA: two-component regulator propeller domain-containing protein, partial [Chitinophagaceae bacterium]|nr:two-component regulator propeller domain-containing protein [Chitinophagaceae bacterium]